MKENLEITLVYQNRNKMILYGFVDEPYAPNGFTTTVNWLQQNPSIKGEKNHIEKLKFKTIRAKLEWVEMHLEFLIEKYYMSKLLFTRYERLIYHETLFGLYEMYKDVVIAGQILPMFLDLDIQQQLPFNLGKLSEDMYKLVNDYASFTSILSTKYVTNKLIAHPINILLMSKENKENEKLFKDKMFSFIQEPDIIIEREEK